ncbi:MAG: hypothetical protein M1546_09855 [Chloroflexi bacterium]|nr:hypothetical protein [Chloroflexota bacterium]
MEIDRFFAFQSGQLIDATDRSGFTPFSNPMNQTQQVLMPRDSSGHQFIFYGDCCSGVPGSTGETNFAAVNRVLRQLTPPPEFICFIGDHIAGSQDSRAELQRQWRHWLDHEMAWLDTRAIPLYHTTSNHNTSDAMAEAIWREIFPDLPQNGPPGQEGLSYYVRRDNLLLVCTNSAYSALGGPGYVECEWLDQVLREHADAAHKLVLGHYPIWPVNGYTDYPTWRVVPEQGMPFWDVLVKHHVPAYLCSHVIAFDVQAHDGVLQITTGGAGTNYGPRDFMPGTVEYLHFVQAAIDAQGLRYQVIDTAGQAREWLRWPFELPASTQWQPVAAGVTDLSEQRALWQQEPGAGRIFVWRFKGIAGITPEEQTLLCTWSDEEGPAALWIGLEPGSANLAVSLIPEPGGGAQVWRGPALTPGQPFAFELAVHTGMGPGGVLCQAGEGSAWSSLRSTSARGAAHMAVPERWALGHAQSGPNDRPFRGSHLQATWATLSAGMDDL